MDKKKFKVIKGNRDAFAEDIVRQCLNAILRRDDEEYDRLHRILHPEVKLSVVGGSEAPSVQPAPNTFPNQEPDEA
jgi:hypothetical protein